MSLLAEYSAARRDEDVARLRAAVALRAMAATGSSQRRIADQLGISQPAVSQRLSAVHLRETGAELLLEAASPIIVQIVRDRGFSRLAVFGSVARRNARADSDIDLLVEAPPNAGIADVEHLRTILERVLDRPVDLVTYGGLDSQRDADILAEAREL